MGKFSRDKGKRGEREVVKLLQPIVDNVYDRNGYDTPELERNLMQSHRGGHDIVGLEWLALEVKHCEQLQINTWWEQTLRQAGQELEPVLFYRRNGVAWRVRMLGYLAHDNDELYVPVDIAVQDFLLYLECRLQEELDQYE